MVKPLFGDDALNVLQQNLDRLDQGVSAHWRQMHQDYRYRDGRFIGMRMAAAQTRAYNLDILRARRGEGRCLFYCCNREEKRLPDGTISRFSDYAGALPTKSLSMNFAPGTRSTI